MRSQTFFAALMLTSVSVLIFSMTVPCAMAQDNSPTRALGTPAEGANLPIQKIGPQDLISIQVYDSPEFTRSIRVSDSGEIGLPMLKQKIKVVGLLPDEISAMIADALKREHLLIDPFVSVTILDYHSRPISVTGAVKMPTIFQAIGDVSLLDALAKAGGPADNAGGELIVMRPNGPNGGQSTQRIAIKALNDGSDPTLNVKLQGGDQVRVPNIGMVVVAGNVHQSGIFPVQEAGTTTVMTAIAQAQGLGEYHPNVAYIYRPDEQGVKHEIEVPLKLILSRKKPDVTLQAKDVLYVPDANGKKNFNLWMDRVAGVGTQAASGALIYRKF
jgi:polysaccharide export outer membrane protein